MSKWGSWVKGLMELSIKSGVNRPNKQQCLNKYQIQPMLINSKDIMKGC